MRVLVACEFSGIVRDAFAAKGHDAWSCDIVSCERGGKHIQCDVLKVLDGWVPVVFAADCDDDGNCPHCGIDFADCGHPGPTQDEYEYTEIDGAMYARPIDCPRWDMMLAFPPCTHLCVSGAKHFAAKRADGRQRQGIDFFMSLANADIPKIAIENPVGIMSSEWREPDQIIQPWMFGQEATKTTCLWLKGLRCLSYDAPLFAESKIVGKGARHVTAGGNSLPEWYNLPPSPERSTIRSRTFPSIAAAMADQWNFSTTPTLPTPGGRKDR